MVDMATTAVFVPLCTSKNSASVTLYNKKGKPPSNFCSGLWHTLQTDLCGIKRIKLEVSEYDGVH